MSHGHWRSWATSTIYILVTPKGDLRDIKKQKDVKLNQLVIGVGFGIPRQCVVLLLLLVIGGASYLRLG